MRWTLILAAMLAALALVALSACETGVDTPDESTYVEPDPTTHVVDQPVVDEPDPVDKVDYCAIFRDDPATEELENLEGAWKAVENTVQIGMIAKITLTSFEDTGTCQAEFNGVFYLGEDLPFKRVTSRGYDDHLYLNEVNQLVNQYFWETEPITPTIYERP